MVEHLLAKERVASSNLVFRSNLLPPRGEHPSTQSPHSATLEDVKSSQRSGTTKAPPREQLLQDFLNLKKSGGISPRSEQWFAWTIKHFFNAFPEPTDITRLSTGQIVEFLGSYNDRRESQHSFYRSLRLFFQWISITFGRVNPFVDQFGNKVIRPPRIPQKPLNTMTPNLALVAIDYAEGSRNRAIVSLLADSGCRRAELVAIRVQDMDLVNRRIRVLGKGGKLGLLIFGPKTQRLLREYMEEYDPTDSLFGLNAYGVQSMLRRLSKKAGFPCNSHVFRRGFATELRRAGLNELDIAELGRWSSTAMVKRYSRAYTFEDAARRYQAIV